MELSPIPLFLKEFLFLDEHENLSEIDFNYYIFTHKDKNTVPDFVERKKILVDMYRLAKKHLDLRLNVTHFFEPVRGRITYEINTEEQLFRLPFDAPDWVQSDLWFDIPMYWFEEETGSVGMSLMPCGIYITFRNYVDFQFSLTQEFFLFSNHLQNRDSYSEKYGRFRYFEPAAKLNREIFRNFAREMNKAFPEFTCEFYCETETVPSCDEYGYPDDAEIFRYWSDVLNDK